MTGWTAISEIASNKNGTYTLSTQTISKDTNWYLDVDVELTGTITIKDDFTLCLNDHVIQSSQSSNQAMFNISSACTVNIYGCADDAVYYGIWETSGKNSEAYSVISSTEYNRLNNNEKAAYTELTGGVIAGGSNGQGGAIYVSTNNSAVKLNIDGVTFAGNGATSNGGAIYYATSGNNSGSLTIEDAIFVDNTAGSNGGAIYIGSNATASIDETAIENNEAKFGGGIYNTGDLTLYDVTITDNKSSSSGGGLYVAGTVTLDGEVVIKDNTSHNSYLSSDSTVYEIGNHFDYTNSEVHVSVYNTSKSLKIASSTNSAVTAGFVSDDEGYQVADDLHTQSSQQGQPNQPTQTNSYVYLEHAHSLVYSLSSTNSNNDTITVTCSNRFSTCDFPSGGYEITIEKPVATAFGSSDSFEAIITNTATSIIATEDIVIVYKDSSGDILRDAPTVAGEYTASITVEGVTASVEYTITAGDSDVIADAGQPGTAFIYTYGEKITLTAEVDVAAVTTFALAAGETENYVSFYVGEKSPATYLGQAVVKDDKGNPTTGAGTATFVYDTTNKDLVIGENEITAYYAGSVNLNQSASNTFKVELIPLEITAEVSETITKVYDGTNEIEVTFTVPVIKGTDDEVLITADAIYTSVNAGEAIDITLSNRIVGGEDLPFYSVSLPEDVTGNITPLNVTEEIIETSSATVVAENVVFNELSFKAVLIAAGEDPVTAAVFEDVTGIMTYSYTYPNTEESESYEGYDDFVEALNAENFEETTEIAVDYTFTATGNFKGIKTGVLTLTVKVDEPVYTTSGNTITVSYDDFVGGTVYISAPTSTIVYDGETAAVVSVVKDGVFSDVDFTISYTKDGEECEDADDGSFTEAGNYVATIVYEGNTATASFTISKAPVIFTVTGNSFAVGTSTEPTFTNDSDLAEDEDYTVTYLNGAGRAVTDLSAAPAGTYTISIEIIDTNYYLSGTVGTVVIWNEAPETYTVSFEEDDGSDVDGVDEITGAVAGSVHTLPTPTKEYYIFAGWSYNSKIYAAGAEFIQPEESVTMTAIWVEDSFTVSGTVFDGSDNALDGVTVTLKSGDTTESTTTDASGEFKFEEVAAGDYEIVASKETEGVTTTSTTAITISGDTVITKILLSINVKTSQEVEAGLNNTSSDLSAVVSNLDTDSYSNGDTVEIKLVVSSASDTEGVYAIANESNDVGYTVDLTVKEIVNDTTVTNLSETPDLISITIDLPAEMQGMAYYTVIRYHDGETQTLTTNANDSDDGEYIELITTNIDGVDVVTAITIYAKYFSTYAVTSSDTVPSYVTGSSTYSSSVASVDNGTVAISSNRSTLNSTVTITPTPDEGYEVGQVTVTYSSGKEVTVTDNGDGTYSYKQPGSSVTVTVTFVESDAENNSDSGLFTDVDEDDWFYDAVLWAVEAGITTGKTEGTFAPYDSNTRAEAVTFLYRAMGEPEYGEDYDFVDTDTDSFYAEALLWATEIGVIIGTSDTTFSPDENCTRAQFITMLWRMMGEPVVNSINLFTDVEADDYYYDAVLWAVGEGIISGTTDTTFSPDENCTRGQIVTFLYRYMGE